MQTILVVSDQLDTKQRLCEVFLQAGFAVLEAENGQACLKIVQTNTPEIVILQLHQISEALNICTHLTREFKLSVLFLTSEAYLDAALDAGATDVMLSTGSRLVMHRTRQLLTVQEAITQRSLAEALRDTASMLNSTLNLEAILDRILVLIQDVIPNDLSTIYMIDGAQTFAKTVRTFSARQPELETDLANVTLPINEIVHLRDMVQNKEALLIDDTLTLVSWEPYPPTAWIRSVVSTLIVVEGEVIGFIFVNAETPGAFSTLDSEMLQIFANQAGLAIANANRYEARNRYAEELKQEVSKRTAELEAKSSQLEVILESIGEGVQGIIFGKTPQSSVYSFVNSALVDLLGYQSDELSSLNQLRPYDVEPEAFEAATKATFDTVMEKGLWKGERRLRHKSGAIVDTELIVSGLKGANGQMIGVVTIFRDLKQQKVLDAQKTRFVANAAHELRNPITSMRARLYLLERQPERIEAHLSVLERITNQLDNLVEDMLDLARFENGRIHLRDDITELTSFVRDTILMMESEAESKNVWIIDRLSKEPLYVSIDQTRMMQVITNLVSNAVKYTPENEAVTVSVQRGEAGTDNAGYMVMHIIDRGDGIPAENIAHIFEPFYQVRETGRGLGLGLAIIKEIIELHGGRISVESEIGKGTTFTVVLKLVEKAV